MVKEYQISNVKKSRLLAGLYYAVQLSTAAALSILVLRRKTI
jgi:hypothetical protein